MSVIRCAQAAAIACVIGLIAPVAPLAGDKVQIKWNGNYPHNNERVWTKENPHYGWTKNFMNGMPEENGAVQSEGTLNAEVFKPKGSDPFPFVIVLHGCSGLSEIERRWLDAYADMLLDAQIGALVLDSFTTRRVKDVCNRPTTAGWAQRRAQDAYSALEYLAETGYADIQRIFVAGMSNGGRTVLHVLNTEMAKHNKFKFSGGFALVPSCHDHIRSSFYAPVLIFLGDKDDANNPDACLNLLGTARPQGHPPIGAILYADANHGYMIPHLPFHYSRSFGWQLSYLHSAAEDTKRRIVAHVQGQLFPTGIERR